MSEHETERDFVSLQTAARLLDVDVRTIRRMIASGEIQGWRVRKAIRVKYTELVAALQPMPTGEPT